MMNYRNLDLFGKQFKNVEKYEIVERIDKKFYLDENVTNYKKTGTLK